MNAHFRQSLLTALLLIAALAAAPARAGLAVDVNEDFGPASCTPGSLMGNYSNAGGAMGVTIYRDNTCPNWQFSGVGRTYLVNVNTSSDPAVPPGTRALWLNEPGATAKASVSGLVAGYQYAFGARAWTDDSPGPTALEVSLGTEARTLPFSSSSTSRVLSQNVCAGAPTADLVLTERTPSGSGASPVVTAVTVKATGALCDDHYRINVAVSGLAAGASLPVQSGADALTFTADGTQAFASGYKAGTPYGVTLGAAPRGQTCSVTSGNASGTMPGADVAVAITCTANPYTVGGTLSGLASGQTVVLLDGNGNPLPLGANGAFTFPATVPSGSPYAVTVGTQPAGQTCTVTNGSGTIDAANVTNVQVDCKATPAYPLGGTVTGLASGATVALVDGNGHTLAVSANGSFTFPVNLANGTPYAVAVSAQPAGQVCSVGAGSGTVAGAAVTSVVVTCASTAPAAIAPVPGLGTWALALLSLLLGAAAWRVPARRRWRR